MKMAHAGAAARTRRAGGAAEKLGRPILLLVICSARYGTSHYRARTRQRCSGIACRFSGRGAERR